VSYYPVFLDLEGQRCVVLGDSDVAATKARQLVDAGAVVTVITGEMLGDSLDAQNDIGGAIRLLRRDYHYGDLAGARLTIDASGDPEVNRIARAEAHAAGVLLNVVDRADQCDFIAPAVVRRGPLQMAISTSGESPFMASALRERLEREFGPEWGVFVALVGELRRDLRRRKVPASRQRAVYDMLLESNVPQLLREGAVAVARRQAKALVGQALRPRQAVGTH